LFNAYREVYNIAVSYLNGIRDLKWEPAAARPTSWIHLRNTLYVAGQKGPQVHPPRPSKKPGAALTKKKKRMTRAEIRALLSPDTELGFFPTEQMYANRIDVTTLGNATTDRQFLFLGLGSVDS
jgi:hypothetical protein